MYHINANTPHVRLSDREAALYIESADQASCGRTQINWQYLAAIDYVRYKHDLSKATNQSILQLADLFIVKNKVDAPYAKKRYDHRSLNEVLIQLAFNPKEIMEVRRYLHGFNNVGLADGKIFPLDRDSSNWHYIDSITPFAIASYNKYGVFPSITIAQAILESGWGKSELSIEANNFFGIKADQNWHGECVSMNTMEDYNRQTVANFRKYNSLNESIADHGAFLYSNKRYLNSGMFNTAYYAEQAEALEKAGYSTKRDQNGTLIYADQLIEIIRQYNLQLIDYDAEDKLKQRSLLLKSGGSPWLSTQKPTTLFSSIIRSISSTVFF
jgi:flagellum-specific peptidoglycan hydrolase FlgJ